MASRGPLARRPATSRQGRSAVPRGIAPSFRRDRTQPKGAHRTRDILHAVLAQVLERVFEAIPDVVAHSPGHADAARLRESLKARGNIDPVTEDAAVLHHDIADVDADAQHHRGLGWERPVGFRERLLDAHGAVDGIYDAPEFGENTVARGPRDIAPAGGNQVVDNPAVSGQRRERAFLVLVHQPRVSLYVRGKDRDELSLEGWRFHGNSHLRMTNLAQQ